METKLVQCRIGAPDTGNSVGLGTAAYSNKFYRVTWSTVTLWIYYNFAQLS